MFGTLEDYYHPHQNLLAYRVSEHSVAPLALHEQPIDPSLPIREPGFLIKAGGYVMVPGFGYIEVNEPGLYRLLSYQRNAGLQWIVFKDSVQCLAASVSSLFHHFAAEPYDADKSNLERRKAAVSYALSTGMNGKVGGVCTTAADTFAEICKRLSLKSIVWEFENLSDPAKPFSTHAMAEVFDPISQKPILFDIDRGYMFLADGGRPLSCSEFINQAENVGDMQFHRINAKSYPGFGAGPRDNRIEDFANDLFQIAGPAFDREFYRIIGTAEIVFGTQAYGDESWVSLTKSNERALTACEKPENNLAEDQRKLLLLIREFSISEFE